MPFRTFLTVCLLTTFAVATMPFARAADDARRQDPLALISQLRTKQLTKLLNLSEEQQKKVQELHDEEAKKLAAIQAENITNVTERFAKQDAVKQETEEKIPPLLTAEQRAKYAEVKAKTKSKKKNPASAPEKK